MRQGVLGKLARATVQAFQFIFCSVVFGFVSVLAKALSSAEYLRWLLMSYTAMRKVKIGALSQAKRLGLEMLALSPKYKDDWNFGNAIHKVNTVLGLAALRENNVKDAKRRLVLSGMTLGSPQLDSFGPNMMLAKELMKVGESTSVLEYFHMCRQFWKSDFGALDSWEQTVQKGGIPNFGNHLLY